MRVNRSEDVGTVSGNKTSSSQPNEGGIGGDSDGNHEEGVIGSGIGKGAVGPAVTDSAPVEDKRKRICIGRVT